MASSEHLQALGEGERVWKEWREAHPHIPPDFRGADLRRRMLRGLDLSSSNFSGADLRDANLRRADLSEAKLDGARLYRVLLSGTKLRGTSFKGTVLYETVFADVDLSNAVNLAECIHKGPSVIDHRTLLRSRGLPRDFLRGCGLPDNVIAEALGPRQSFKRYWSCFISYSSRDQAFADRLYRDLQAHGIRCWFAPKDMPIGAKIRDAIDEAIRGTGKMLLVLSENSMASNWVEKEFETAFEEERRRRDTVVFPVRLDKSPFESTHSWIADVRRARHIGDFSGWKNNALYRGAFERLLHDLQCNAQDEPSPPLPGTAATSARV